MCILHAGSFTSFVDLHLQEGSITSIVYLHSASRVYYFLRRSAFEAGSITSFVDLHSASRAGSITLLVDVQIRRSLHLRRK